MNTTNPVGVFDSGLGGLTVVKEIIKQMPKEQVIYLGDTARVPYGNKSKESVIKFSKENAHFLSGFDVKALVIACNTASSCAYEILKTEYNFPVISVIEPGAKSACQQTKNGKIGVIGTYGTVKSQAYEQAIKKINSSIDVFSHPCPLFVPLVEEGWINTEVTLKIAQTYLEFFADKNIDTLILGCTHYPLLKEIIQKAVGNSVALIDSAEVVVKELKRVLSSQEMLNLSDMQGTRKFFVTDYTDVFVKTGRTFLNNTNIDFNVINLDITKEEKQCLNY